MLRLLRWIDVELLGGGQSDDPRVAVDVAELVAIRDQVQWLAEAVEKRTRSQRLSRLVSLKAGEIARRIEGLVA